VARPGAAGGLEVDDDEGRLVEVARRGRVRGGDPAAGGCVEREARVAPSVPEKARPELWSAPGWVKTDQQLRGARRGRSSR
jgi:hypothetical protein